MLRARRKRTSSGTLPFMGEIFSLAEGRRRRSQERRERARQAVMHPALRWWVRGDTGLAHRRQPGGSTVCGRLGPLLLADEDTAFCSICYPYWSSIER